MITRLTLKPGQKGTKALVEKYGSDPVCIRYRYDEESRMRIKTVELIEEKKWLPAKQQKFADEALVPVRIAYGELDLGKMARKLGGKWDPAGKVWHIKYGNIKGTVLEVHMVLDAKEKKWP